MKKSSATGNSTATQMLGMFRHRDPATGYIKRRSPTCGASPDAQVKPRAVTTTSSSATSSSAALPAAATMAAAVDVFFLTFNCAKNLVDVPVFATHLLSALGQRESGPGVLPDLVAFSLQEVAPMSYSFIGPYFLDPYLAAYGEALNLAADAFNDPATDHDHSKLLDRQRTAPPTYTIVGSKNVGMTAVLLFAKEAAAVVDMKEAEVGFGAAEMGNKGAAGLRAVYKDTESSRSAELTFVGTHLAAMEWNLAKRNANWATIMRGLTFENPEDILKPRPATSNPSLEEDGENGDGRASAEEVMRLLHDQHNEESRQMQQRLQDISVFKPTSHLFVAGDLNYRISATSPTPNASFPSLDPESENYYTRFFPLDQLTRERKSGRTLHGLSEADVEFPPTYKYDIVPGANNPLEVTWKFAPHRYPSWTDRVLYLDVPPWTKEQNPDGPGIKVQAYNALPILESSDHRPVFFRADVPMIAKEDLLSPDQQGDSSYPAEWDLDPRAKLPVEIDPEAWERRAAARQREVMAGWSMFFFSTQEGTLVLGSLVVAALSGWWLYQQW